MNSKLQITDLAYNSSACLHFRVEFPNVEEAIDAVELIGQYNEFSPDKVASFLRSLPHDTRVGVGREYSPVIYVKAPKKEVLALAQTFELRVDELDTVGIWCRLWWD